MADSCRRRSRRDRSLVAASGEPTEELRAARRRLDDLGSQVRVLADWVVAEGASRYWRLALELHPDELAPSAWVPATTRWQVLVDRRYPVGEVALHPAAVGGMTATFQHQRPNLETDRPWRLGRICTSESVSGHPLAIARSEPRGAEDRLAWHVLRALDWLRAASRGELVRPGDPFELPVYDGRADSGGVAFRECIDDLPTWLATAKRAGIAELVPVNRDRTQFAVRAFQSPLGLDVVRPHWGAFIADARNADCGVWLRLDQMPYREPWAAPRNWGELREVLRGQGRDLTKETAPYLDQMRDGWSHVLLLGFPIPRVVGEDAIQLHWIAAELPALNRDSAKTPVNGFRTKTARLIADVGLGGALSDRQPIEWRPTTNWHPDELASRGRWSGALRGKVVLIGAGALGSNVGNLLVRGGTIELAIIDREVLLGPNLVRHELSMDDLLAEKASALAARLNSVAPNARVRGFDSDLLNLSSEARDALRSADVIIDTTGSDEVIEGLGLQHFDTARVFASISLSYGADHLYFFVARGQQFPVDNFRSAFAPWLGADSPEIADMNWEGTGCWNPVFPARIDDLAAFNALAARQIDALTENDLPTPAFRVFERVSDGTIAKISSRRAG